MTEPQTKKSKTAGKKHGRDETAAATPSPKSAAAPPADVKASDAPTSPEAAKLAEATKAHEAIEKDLVAVNVRLGSFKTSFDKLVRQRGEDGKSYQARLEQYSAARKSKREYTQQLEVAADALDDAQMAVALKGIGADLKDSAFKKAMDDADSKDGEYRALAWFLRAWRTFALASPIRQDQREGDQKGVFQMLAVFCEDLEKAGVEDVSIVNEFSAEPDSDEQNGEDTP